MKIKKTARGYRIDFYHPLGHRRIRKVFRAANQAEAKLMFEQFRSKLLNKSGALPESFVLSPKLCEAIESYTRACSVSKSLKSQEADRKALAALLRSAGNRPVEDFEDVDIGDFISHCRNERNWMTSTINRNLNTIRHFLGWAFRKGWMPKNLAKSVGRVSGPTRESRPIKNADIEKILNVAAPGLKLQILLGLTWGLRRAEIATLSWKVVNFETGRVQIGGTADFNTKSGKTKIVFLTPNLETALRAHKVSQKVECEWLFPNKGISGPIDPHVITRGWCRARKKAKVQDAKLHDLRATAGTRFAELGYGDSAIAKLLGHSTEKMARKYSNHVEEKILRRAVSEAENPLLHQAVNGISHIGGQNTGTTLRLVRKDEPKI